MALLRILAFAPTFTALNSILGVNTLLAGGLASHYAAAQHKTVAAAAPAMAMLVYALGPLGAAVGTLLTDMLMTLFLVLACRRANVLSRAFALS